MRTMVADLERPWDNVRAGFQDQQLGAIESIEASWDGATRLLSQCQPQEPCISTAYNRDQESRSGHVPTRQEMKYTGPCILASCC